jgi:hypothetical protein
MTKSEKKKRMSLKTRPQAVPKNPTNQKRKAQKEIKLLGD